MSMYLRSKIFVVVLEIQHIQGYKSIYLIDSHLTINSIETWKLTKEKQKMESVGFIIFAQ